MKLKKIFESVQKRNTQLLREGRLDVLRQKFVDANKVSEDEFTSIAEIDPTPGKEYTQWLLNKFIKEIVNGRKDATDTSKKREVAVFLEDAYKYKEYLDIYFRLRKKFPKTDINQYSLQDFKNDAIEIKNNSSEGDLGKGLERTDKWAKYKIGTVDGFICYEIPKGRQDLLDMSCDLGSGTEWCTAVTDSRYFKQYIEQGPLYIFYKPGSVERYQFHFESGQFMDKNDNSVI
jgi:hypothetical protein